MNNFYQALSPTFDSQEEGLFWLYLNELKENGYIDSFTFHPDPYVLSEPVKYEWEQKLKTKTIIKSSVLLNGHIYTPDFVVIWNKKAKDIFYINCNSGRNLKNVPFITNGISSVIEVKPAWDAQNMSRLWTINAKWVWEKYHIYVQKIVPIAPNSNCLFAKTFVPQLALLTEKTKKPKSYKFEVRSLQQYLESVK
jgi:hypothetical protein